MYSYRKIHKKLLPPELLFWAQICTKSFIGLTAPPQLYLGGLLLRGEGEVKVREGREFVLCHRKKKEKSALWKNYVTDESP